jgi:hypothetical protein
MSPDLSKTDLGRAVRLIQAACWDTFRRCSFAFGRDCVIDSVTLTGVLQAYVTWPLCYQLRELGKRLQQSVDEFQRLDLDDLLLPLP